MQATFANALTRILVVCCALVFAIANTANLGAQEKRSASYDPMIATVPGDAQVIDLNVSTGEKREIPIRFYLSASAPSSGKSPVVLFSHGLGGSREGSPHIGKHWAQRGYVAIFLQHPGSDTTVWRDVSMSERMKAMNSAASAQNLVLRCGDVKGVLDLLEAWQKDPAKAPREIRDRVNTMDLSRIGMSGHSFGAVTTQAVSGQKMPMGRGFSDPRIKASVIMSPSSPRAGNVKSAFDSVQIPWLIMTGTKDVSPIGNQDVASRLAVYPSLPEGSKYELVLNEAEHSFPNDRSLPRDKGKRNPNHTRAVLGLSTAFWDAHLRNDDSATQWLNGNGPRSILESADTWKAK
jgi:predicted dienelactone hydrolase